MENSTALRTASLLHDTARTLTRLLDRQLAPHDVTAQQAALMINLAGGETSPNRLAVLLGTDTAGTSRLIDRLAVKGLLRRHRGTTDRRSVVLELTDTGQKLVPALVPTFGRVATDLFNGLTDADIRRVGDALERALKNTEARHLDERANA
ncbi:MarR family winged helix-turn-helix transcriptional regulator [Nocardia rhamnosiphila]|uniref:MarR family transcriptional regulator n=1 Tax=Nocardia rhamnosiphila TaxID=426716 RepID=A0ABV2WTT4_9NOCA